MGLLALAAERRVLFVSGKGGVGKTSVSSALALARARTGARVLLVSTDPAHNLGHAWERELGDSASRLWAEGSGCVDVMEIDPAATVERHLAGVRASLHRLLPERLHAGADRHLEHAREAPGTHESAILERIADAMVDGLDDHDLVVFDTAPTGHTLRLMALPETMTAWTESLLANRDRSERFGAAVRGLGGSGTLDRDAELRRLLVRRQRRFAALRDAVVDAATTAFVLVTTAERLPVTETLDLHARLSDLGIDVGAVVVNRRSPAAAGEFLATRRAAEEQQVTVLTRGLVQPARRGGGPLVHQVELQAAEPVGADGLGRLADLLV